MGETMTTEGENKKLVRRFIDEMVNGQHYDLADELLTDDYTRHDPDTPTDEQGPGPFVESLERLQAAFPGEITVGETIAEGDLVAFEATMIGTHEGEFLGVEPTHIEVEVPGQAMHRIRDGKIAETWATWNFLGVLQQVGAVEAPGQ
jgi:steroid delta-isomerase-like uncharacterized protein